MKDQDTHLIWEQYKSPGRVGGGNIPFPDGQGEMQDDNELRAKLKELQAAMDYHNHVDDHGKWQEEAPERERISKQIKDITDELKRREFNSKSPDERKPPTEKKRFIPGGPKARFMPSEVREIKMKMRDQGIFSKLLGDLDNPRNQTRVAVFYIKYGALPTQEEFGKDWLHQGEGEMSPFPFLPAEHPDLEGTVWERYYVNELGDEVEQG